MALDFPSPATAGQQFVAGSTTWQFDGVKWVAIAGVSSCALGDTPPSNPGIGSFWWDSIGGQLYVYYTDPNSSEWVPATNQGGAPLVMPPGVTNGSNAAAGQVGEFLSALVANNTVSMPTNTQVNITSISLTAGDWDVEGGVSHSSASSTMTYGEGTISSVSATRGLPIFGLNFTTAMNTISITVPRVRFSLTATTTIYLVGMCQYSTSTAAAGGYISARRMR